jgi:hypothetical protein
MGAVLMLTLVIPLGPPPAGDAITLLDQAVRRLRSFDIWYTVTVKQLLITEQGPSGPIGRRALRPDEIAPSRTIYFHHIWSNDGERLDLVSAAGEVVSTQLFTADGGDYLIEYSFRHASIRKYHVMVTQEGWYYPECFLNFYQRAPLIGLLKERSARLAVNKSGTDLVLESEPLGAAGKGNLPTYGVRVTVSAARNFFPEAIERTSIEAGKLFVNRKLGTVRWQKLAEDFEVPTRIVSVVYDCEPYSTFGKPLMEIVLNVDESRSSWNKLVPADVFAVRLPRGFLVNDEVKGIKYTAEASETLARLDELVAASKNYLVNDPPRPPVAAWDWRRTLIWWLIAIILLLVGVFVATRFKGRRRDTR